MPNRGAKGSRDPAYASDLESLTIKSRTPVDGVT
jgi:hypothetical protein